MDLAQLSGIRHTLQTAAQAHAEAIVADFQQAHLRAGLQEVLARMTGRSNQLLSFDEVTSRLHLAERADAGHQAIPLAAIVGSVGRYADFTRSFLPRHSSDQERWARIKEAVTGPEPVQLPPIEVYKIGQAYFVLDGNHRVSVARQSGRTHIDAHVIEVPTSVPLNPAVTPDDLIVKAEYADFLAQTGLSDLARGCDLSLTAPGGYQRLRQEIALFDSATAPLGASSAARTESVNPTAAHAWFNGAYLPAVLAIRAQGLLRWFPDRTEADLYLWTAQHRQALEEELGWAIRPEAAISDLAVKHSPQAESEAATPGSWRQTRLVDRYADRLFRDILVPLEDDAAGWQALDQALLIARREEAQVQGLHLARTEAQRASRAAEALRAKFHERCAAAQVAGSLLIETGAAPRKISERALLADLVILSAAHPPAPGLASLGSGLRGIIWNCARPVLAVPAGAAPLQRALLAYDGSPKSKEALFVAAYLAERWHTALTVLTLLDGARVLTSVLDYPRAYLDLHELPAEYIVATGNADVFLGSVRSHQADLIVMGGYSVSALVEVMGGSAVNYLLRQAPCPLLLCR